MTSYLVSMVMFVNIHPAEDLYNYTAWQPMIEYVVAIVIFELPSMYIAQVTHVDYIT